MSGFSPSTDPFVLGPGSTPNWVAGYRPPAAEWNQWFSNKVDVDDPSLQGGPWLSLSGGTMLGRITLAGPPVNALDCATKAYVDAITPVSGPFLPQSGGTMSGILTLVGNPSGPLDATPRQYVDSVGTTASQALSVAQGAVPRTGATMTGPLVLSQNPSSALGAATKQYVDGFLPLTGGYVSGLTTFNAQVSVTGNFYTYALFIGAFNNYEWNFSVNSQGSKFVTYRSGWYDYWDGTNGTRGWMAPGNYGLMVLGGNGDLTVTGKVTINGVGITYNRFDQDAIAFGWNGFVNLYVNGTYEGDVATTSWVNGSLGNYLPLSGGAISGNLGTNGTLYSGSMMTCGAGLTVYGPANLTNALQVGSYFTCSTHGSIGDTGWYYSGTGNNHGFQIWYGSPNIFIRMDGSSDVYVGVPSDENLKQDIAPSTFNCLDVIRRIPLFQFRFRAFGTGDDEGKTFDAAPDAPIIPVGFVAQRQQEIFPDSVVGEKSLSIDTLKMVAALVGAVQTLADRVDALGGGR